MSSTDSSAIVFPLKLRFTAKRYDMIRELTNVYPMTLGTDYNAKRLTWSDVNHLGATLTIANEAASRNLICCIASEYDRAEDNIATGYADRAEVIERNIWRDILKRFAAKGIVDAVTGDLRN